MSECLWSVPRNAQIADLQQKVLVADSEGRLKQRLDTITSIVDAKSVLKALMTEVGEMLSAESHRRRFLDQ